VRLGVTELVVVDLETTGMGECPPDRALEVAVVRLAPDGTRVGEWDTLLQPDRPVDAAWLHGITDGMVLGAPRFAEIAGELVPLLEGAVVVGHNPAFDVGFLRGELALCGRELPQLPLLCTLELTRRLYPDLDSYRLSSCCAWFGITQRHEHAALDDARATAALLRRLLVVAGLRGLDHLEALLCQPGEPLPPGWWNGVRPAPRPGRVLHRTQARSALPSPTSSGGASVQQPVSPAGW